MQNSKQVTLGIVNRIYADRRTIVKYRFKNDVQNFFHSDIVDTNFLNADETVKKINEWCSQQTHGKIKDIVTKRL